jgi:ubiquinone/menaquinone biosynthesis C-methylase UbiE
VRPALPRERLARAYAGLARRYDLQHKLLTASADQRGRELLVDHAVGEGDVVLDCGAGTGTTGILAARTVGPRGKVVLLDVSDEMLAVARDKIARDDLHNIEVRTGDLLDLPFADGSFDVVLSTYSLCPVFDPVAGALEMYRVTRPGGKIGVAHSTEPRNRMVRALADRVENVAWRFPALSMGCRAVDVLPALEQAGARLVFQRRIGVPLWPFQVFVVAKPAA